MKININLFTLLLLQLLFQSGISQDSALAFHLVDGPDGKPLGHVRCISQDKYGYIWMAAQGSRCIYRYDGNRFVIFRHNDNDPNSLSSAGINFVYADNKGLIWIGMGNGLDQYNPATGIFKHYDIKAHHGEINVDTREGENTEFIIQLPLT